MANEGDLKVLAQFESEVRGQHRERYAQCQWHRGWSFGRQHSQHPAPWQR